MKHSELALLNFQRARRGGEDEGQHPGFEWRITMFFYAAMHAVDAVLIEQRVRPSDHDQRRQKVFTDPAFASSLAPLRSDYRELERLSRQARYMPEAHPMTVSEYQEARDRARRLLEGLGHKIS